jgi:hypothetical protein
MSNNAHVGELIKGWLKRQSALDEKADNARELGLDYEPDKTIEMAREAGFDFSGTHLTWEDVICTEELKTFAALVRADEREACAKVCDVIYCDYCADAIRARGQE